MNRSYGSKNKRNSTIRNFWCHTTLFRILGGADYHFLINYNGNNYNHNQYNNNIKIMKKNKTENMLSTVMVKKLDMLLKLFVVASLCVSGIGRSH